MIPDRMVEGLEKYLQTAGGIVSGTVSFAANIDTPSITLPGFAALTSVATAGADDEKIATQGYADGIIPDGTSAGQLAFWDTAATRWEHTEATEVVWNDALKNVGIGVAALPTNARLSVRNTVSIQYGIYVDQTSSSSGAIFINTTKHGMKFVSASPLQTAYLLQCQGNAGAIKAIHVGGDGKTGFGTETPARVVDALDATNPQLRLTRTAGVNYADFESDSSGICVITPSGGEVSVVGRVKEQGAYASIYYSGVSVSQSIPLGTTYTKITTFASNGLSANCTADAANDKITLTKPGIYRVTANISGYSGNMSELWEATLFLNAVEQSQFYTAHDASTLHYHFQTMSGFIDVTTAGWDLDLRLRHNDPGTARDFYTFNATISVDYVGET